MISDRFMITATSKHERLKCRDRQVIAAGELTDADRKLIAQSRVSEDYAYLDNELKDWQP